MNWGLIGYGEVTLSFIDGLKTVKDARIVAIASKSSHQYLVKKGLYENVQYFDSYENLLKSSEIDIVYVSTTNNLHFENVKQVLYAGKHCLCEKPMTPTARQTDELIDLANKNNVFLMEGMWTRFLPAYREFIKVLKSGIIGKPRLLKADFGFLNTWPKNRRLLNPELNGGTLLDNADYNIFLSQDVFNEYPIKIQAMASYAETGVEDACSIQLQYASGGIAQLFSSFRCETEQEAIVYGEKGYIKLKEYWHGTQIAIKIGEIEEEHKFPFKVNGFEYQIENVQKSIKNGRIENNFVSHSDSKNVAMIIDEVQNQIHKKQ
ncbi:Gfo/Idh/MocA family protein [Winogradskyella luteola]|uniref:Gfo/Idh/MocA family oxidoreductase n=1 Tax=Winogradskyella luteola TaxID=2828330 RepID=A0A9X1FBR7_9FLAO|nr:Gfo/Idh/MocA family oxidoreductase [Winogradskyella luteola]MBV7270696.1 Gfo/Idh/MocA family oxidoreductase [Winogradskyella luteola]